MPQRKRRTWAQVGIKNGGMRATTRALRFAMGWGLATAELHREPETVEEYAEVMEISRASAFRDQAAFRKCFPDESSPARMNAAGGQQARYDEIWRTAKDTKTATEEAEPSVFDLGAGPALSG